MLTDIQNTVAQYAQTIARIMGVDAEVVDVKLTRLAGTGQYAAGVGQNIRGEGEVYRHVMRIRRTFVLENPREHFICYRCDGREFCQETLSMSTPIVDRDEVVGVIGLVCFTMKDRERFLENRDTYIAFLEQCAEFILHKLNDHNELNRAQSFLDLMLRILEVNSRGILIFNAKGGISYLNDIARRDLGLEGERIPTDVTFKRTGESFSDLEEYVVSIHDRTLTLMGQMVSLTPPDYHFAMVFTFESLPRMVRRVSSFGSGALASSGLDSIQGRCTSILRLKEQIRQIAQSTSTVLVTGESGTGKELVARAIHAVSDRHDKPFIGINCGAIPDALLESELFGYTGGAFTGANSKGRIGKFELAHKGVLFLDEITTMPLYLQVKMLRVLQERTFTRLGSNRLIEVDIRVIAATNENLANTMQQGRFREDLFYRLNVIPLNIPPLRQRQDDIELLATHFLAKYGELFGKQTVAPDPDVLAALTVYPWPGNVREFENVMEFMVTMMEPGGPLHVGLLPPNVRAVLSTPAALPSCAGSDTGIPASAAGSNPPDTQNIPPIGTTGMTDEILPLHELEKRAIHTALARFGNDTAGKKAAAEALGISVATLYRKVREVEA